MRPFLIFAALWMSLATSAQLQFNHNGVTRTYFMDAPNPIPPGAPLVVVLHGYTSNASAIRYYSDWDEIAMSEGVVVVYPQGRQDFFGITHWNANLGISTADDHGFLVALVQHLQQQHGLSPDCTYSCGMSNGGYMSYSLACEHPEVFAAVGSVTGSMGAFDFGCTPNEVVPILHLHGTNDDVVTYQGGVGASGWGSNGIEEVIEHWTDLMGTTTLEQTTMPNQETFDFTSVDFLRYAGSPTGQEFHHYRVNGGGHDWFGAWGSQDVESTAVLWDFFATECAGGFTDVADSSPENVLIERWRSGIEAKVNCRVDIRNVLGQLVDRVVLQQGETWTALPAGFHLICATTEAGERQTIYTE